jgi:hypothetical protein
MSAPKLNETNIQTFAEEGRSPLNTARSNDSVSVAVKEKSRAKTVAEVAPRFRLSNPFLSEMMKTAKVQEARGRRSRKQKKSKKRRSTRRK